ncbi:MAG TPA: DUF3696 domain-containing protein [Solirubrobacterales bacterium]|nr:DUF3696 domain-containing protein [Solirubrobacterales bacterium]
MADAPGILGHTHEIGVRWRNFRGFADTGWLRLKPITVFIGANNGGKSSLLEPLLLMKQSMLSRTGGNALLTRGTYHDSGSFRDFVHMHDPTRPVKFELRWHSHPSKPSQPVGAYAPGGADFTFIQGAEPETVSLASYRVFDTHQRLMLKRTRRDTGTYSLKQSTKLPEIPPKISDPDLRRVIRDDKPVDFLFRSSAIREAALQPADSEGGLPALSLSSGDSAVDHYCAAIEYVNFQIQAILERLNYIGPLREPAKRVYSLSGEMPPDVGTHGENAPEIIYRWRHQKAVLKNLRKWLKHFEFNADLIWDSVGFEGFSLLLQHEKDAPTSFLDVGFGVSQVLPLIVQGLKSRTRSWTITEQPEIHLNPRLQAKLADFFVSLANQDKGLLIETHSEHFLLRLRSLVAGGEIPAENVALYYVEATETGSSVRSVPIQTNGYIDPKNWPAGFFEDSLRESLRLAHTQSQYKKDQ